MTSKSSVNSNTVSYEEFAEDNLDSIFNPKEGMKI